MFGFFMLVRASVHLTVGDTGFIQTKRKSSETLDFQGFFGGRNRTRTCDPIDVNDVLSALRSFVREGDN